MSCPHEPTASKQASRQRQACSSIEVVVKQPTPQIEMTGKRLQVGDKASLSPVAAQLFYHHVHWTVDDLQVTRPDEKPAQTQTPLHTRAHTHTNRPRKANHIQRRTQTHANRHALHNLSWTEHSWPFGREISQG